MQPHTAFLELQHLTSSANFPDSLPSLPTTIKRIIVHVGSNDTSRQQSELTKADFIRLVDLLNSTGKSAFISGPIPTLGRGISRFSRILSLHTWLQSVCSTHNIGFIHNFNLFWNRSPLFARDGLHPSSQGSRLLAGNLQHGVLFTPWDWLSTSPVTPCSSSTTLNSHASTASDIPVMIYSPCPRNGPRPGAFLPGPGFGSATLRSRN